MSHRAHRLPRHRQKIAHGSSTGVICWRSVSPLPSHMPRVGDVMLYQVSLSTHQEIELQWDLIPGIDRAVRRDGVAEGSLSSNFVLLSRKQSVRGNARTSTLTLSDMTLVTAAVAAN